MTTRDLYYTTRRAYRSAEKDFLRTGATLQTTTILHSMLRTITNRFDCGTGKPSNGGQTLVTKKIKGRVLRVPFTSAACARWMRSH